MVLIGVLATEAALGCNVPTPTLRRFAAQGSGVVIVEITAETPGSVRFAATHTLTGPVLSGRSEWPLSDDPCRAP